MQNTISQNTNQKNLLQLLWLRLIAILGQVVTILFTCYFLQISLPLRQMFMVLLGLGAVACFSFCRYNLQKNISDKSLFFELLFDVVALTAQLYFSGGISNPFISLFLLQVIIGAILLRRIYAWIIAAITVGCYIWLSFNFWELHAFHSHEGGDFFNLHLHGMLISYVFAAILLLIFVTKIIKNLQEGDQKINLLNRQSLEREQVVRMGLLATGAAHELGTPLATIAVIVSDWKKDATPDLVKDIAIVESQISRCKKILSDILSSSGKDRAEQTKISTAKKIFDDLVQEWSSLRNPQNLIYNFIGDVEKKIILDDILAQAFFNIFDNALEASAAWVSIDVNVGVSDLKLSVEDRGQGFSREILEKIGAPNLSGKNGSGLGLFLALNSLQRVEGKLEINNLVSGGARVEVIIPLRNVVIQNKNL